MYYKKIIDESINKEIRLCIINNKKTEIFGFNFFKKFLLKLKKLKKNKRKIISFDIEFNTPPKSTGLREIALFQLCFHAKKFNLIFFFNPKICSDNTRKLIIKILINKKIIKIGHGTDSLDINAIFTFLNNNLYCKKFTNTLYDTRFLCEYLNLFTDNNLCNIYYLLNKYNIIIKSQYDYLEENNKQLGEFWNTFIDIKNLSEEFINYSLYDTIYLKYLIKKMFLDFDKPILKLLIQVLQLVLLMKKNIIVFPNIDKFNLYFNKDNYNLSSLFKIKFNLFMSNLNVNISKIFIIPLFKKPFLKIFMLIFYYKQLVISKITCYVSKNNIISKEDINYISNSYISFFSSIKNYKYITNILDNFLL